MLLLLTLGLVNVHAPAANSGADNDQAAALLGQLDGVFPIGVVFASGERGIDGVLRWTALGRPDGSYARFPDSALKISMEGAPHDTYYVYCFGRRSNDGVSQSRSEPATVCAPLDDADRQAAYDRFGVNAPASGLLPRAGVVGFEGDNGEYYAQAGFANGSGMVLQSAHGVLIGDISVLFQGMADGALTAAYSDYLLVLVPAGNEVRLNRGTVGNGCHDGPGR